MAIVIDGTSLVLLGFVFVVVVIAIFGQSSNTPDISPYRLIRQAIVGPTRNKGESGVYRHPSTPRGTPLIASFAKDNIYNAAALIEYGFKRNLKNDFLGTRINDGPFVWQTYEQVFERIKNAGSGIIEKFGLKKDASFGIFLKNSPEWTILDYACCFYGFISVPMYDTFDGDALTFIVKNTDISVVSTSVANIDRVLSIAGACSVLKNLIIVDADKIGLEVEQRAAALKIKLFTLKEIESIGKASRKPFAQIDPEDLYTICYTSGTTGTPKGVMLTHQNFTAAAASFIMLLPPNQVPDSSDRHLSYLPLSHMFERIICVGMTYCGTQIGYFRGDILKLFDDIVTLQPTVFPSVPRLLNRLYDRIKMGIDQSSPLKKMIFNYAYAAKLKMLDSGKVTKSSFWDMLVFGKIQAKLGGRMKLMISASAPISPDVLEFLRVVLGCNVLEGYGQTETCASGTLSTWGDYTFPFGSHVGVPFPCCEIKLLDVPAMNYSADDKPNPRGEVCFRGPNVMKGYFKEPEKTKEVLDADGWLRTGDIGEIMPNGTLKIVDRNF